MKTKALLKRRQVIFISFSIIFLSNLSLYAQSVEADFLLYSPSPVITGMGGSGTGLPIDDPYNFFYNPAQLGLGDTNTNLSVGIYPSSVNLSGFNTEVLFDNYAIHGGYDFSKLLGGFPLTLGAGFLYQGIDFGEYLRTNENGIVLGKVNPYEKAATFSLGFGFNYFIRIAGGISYKLIWSDMNVLNGKYESSDMKGNADAFDLGVLTEIPILNEMHLSENLSLNLSASVGYTFANWGSDMVYTINNNDFGEPIARTVRLGYGLSAGIDYKYKETEFKLIQIDWTSEANDLLAKSRILDEHDSVFSMITYNSSAPFGEINFWDNVILLKNTSASTVNRHGVRVSMFETANISFGGYSKPHTHIKTTASTFGFCIGTMGVMKFLSQEIKNDIIDFIAKHISLQYSYSRIKFDEVYYLNDILMKYPDQSYNALYLTISGLW